MPTEILILDGDAIDRKSTRSLLRQSSVDASVTDATDPAECLALLEADSFDCLLLDDRLPDMEGVDFLIRLRAGKFRHLPVIMLSGDGGEQTALRAIRSGAQDLIAKKRISADLLEHSINGAIRMMKLEAQKTESDRRFQDLFDNASEGIYRTTPDGRYVAANPAIARMHGCRTPEEFMALHTNTAMQIYANPNARDEVTEHMRAHGFVNGFECLAKRVDGSQFWMRESGRAVVDENGRLLGYEGFVEDISERKVAEARLRESEVRFRMLYNQTPVMMQSVDRNGKMLSVSDFWLESLGYSREEVVGRNVTDFLTDESRRYAVETVIPEFHRTGACKDIEYQFVKKDGSIVDILLSAVAKRDRTGAFESSLTVLIDVTERRKMQEQLLQSQKMEAVGQLTGGLAHDFNNLLAVVIGNLQLLERQPENRAEIVKRAGAAIDAARRGADLTQRLLALSRQQHLQSSVIDANALVVGMEDLLRRTLGASIRIETNLADHLGAIQTDAHQLESAILNLAVNATDAMEGQGRLTITTEKTPLDEDSARHFDLEPGEYVALSVADSGPGMPPDVIEKAFQPFFTTKPVGKGTGLGLSMVYSFARQMGGSVEIDSAEGQGTTVKILLPMAIGNHRAEVAPTQETGSIVGGREKILVVDDNPDVREISCSLLEDLGYTVLQADGGLKALVELSRHSDIDMLFTDIVMPDGMSGHELAMEAVRSFSHLKVVFTSGFADPAVLGTKNPGFDSVILRKPFSRCELASSIRSVFDEKAAVDQSTQISLAS